jgi:competence protein ComEC
MAASFALGIFLVGSAHLPGPAAAALPVCVAVCLLLGLLVLRAGWKGVSLIFALLGFLAAGASAGCLFEYRFPVSHVSKLAARGIDLQQPVRLDGRIASTPLRAAYGLQFDLEAKRAENRTASCDVTGKVRLRLEGSERAETWALLDGLHLQYGDAIRVLVRLRKPRIYQNPGSFDFRRWMESTEDVYWVGTVKNPLLVEKLPGADDRVSESDPCHPERSKGSLQLTPGSANCGQLRRSFAALRMTVGSVARVFTPDGISRLAERVRGRLLGSIDDLYPRWSAQGRCGSVLKAVLLGDRSALDSETIESFRKTGLYHLLVIAGLHVGLLALLADWLLRLVGLGARARRLTVLALLIFYAFLVEQRAPTLRATLMIAFYLLAGLLYRRSSTLNAIGLAALVLLLWRPAWLFESGFQLSFSAALLIAGLAVPILERTTEPYRRALRGFDEIQLDAHLAPRLAQFRVELRALVAWLKSRFRVLERHDALTGALVTGPARALLWTANILLFSAVLQVGLLLPMATTFHRVALAGIGLNALAIPVMTLLLALAVPTVLLGALIPALAVWPAKVLAVVMAGLFAMTELPHLPAWLSFRVPNPPLWVSCGFVVFIVGAALALGRRQASASDALTSGLSPAAPPLTATSLRAWALPVSLAGLGVMTVLVATHPFPPRLPTGRLEVTALDCGQGESLFVVLPDRTTMLVDGSGSRQRGASEGALQGRPWDPGEDIVSPYLWSRGIKKIDIVVLSIPHEDHLGGLFAVARNFRIGEFWHAENGAARAYWDLLGKLREKGVVERTLQAGDKLERGGASVRALWPERSLEAAASFSNDDSLVLRIAYGGDSVLLTGDITAKAERGLLISGQELHSLVLKAAHHGSNSSSSREFLAQVNPRLALISGSSFASGNLRGADTLERLRERGIPVFRPDVNGATTVEMSGSLRATTFRPPNP